MYFKYFFRFFVLSILFFAKNEGIANSSQLNDFLLREEVQDRLQKLRQFTPYTSYRWYIHWSSDGKSYPSTFTSTTFGHVIDIQINFWNGNSLNFSKNNSYALYPNRLSFLKKHKWHESLNSLPGVCFYMIAMPFLDWPITSCEKTAKMGRRCIRVLLTQAPWQAEIFLDKKFKTILAANLQNDSHSFLASFLLKRLKKFKQGWGIKAAEFSLNKQKTTLYVDDIVVLQK